MPKAVLDEARCQPDRCPGGRCLARKSCPIKAIYQDEPNTVPFVSAGMCNGCFKCAASCPAHAIVQV